MQILFHYKPEGVAPRTWPFAPGRMSNAEAEAIEDLLDDVTFIEWQDKVLRGSVKCTRLFLFLQLRKTTPSLELDQVVFNINEVELEIKAEDDDLDEIEAAANAGTEPDPKAPSE